MKKRTCAVTLSLAVLAGASDAAEWSAPAEERAKANPVAGSPEVLKAAKRLYTDHCAQCHGREGKGKKMYTGKDDPQPKDLTDKALQARLTDGEIFWKLSTGRTVNGKEYMPGFAGKIAAADKRWGLVHVVRSLAQ
jgi:mono/diheme cytochrome c family protein